MQPSGDSALDGTTRSGLVARRTPLAEIAGLFLKLGTTAFGGPAAHIAMMEDEVVRRRGWLSRDQFLDFLGATNLIPGPNSTELAIHVGLARAGTAGLVVAGACFILPAALIVGVIAWAYVRFGMLPAAEGFLYGVKPVVMAVVLQALWRFARTAMKTKTLATIGVAAIVATALGMNELAVLAAAGVVTALVRGVVNRNADGTVGERSSAIAALTIPAAGNAVLGAVTGNAGVALWPLFGAFAKIGAVLFGSGYVLLAFLRADFVERLHWLTERQLLDAVAVGQFTPGPVFTTATFIGYVLAGAPGAAVATLGIFLPAFVFVALSGPLVPRLRRSRVAGAVLDGVNVASLALMAVVTWQLGGAALVDPLTIGLAIISAALLFYTRVNSAWLVIAGGLIGIASTRLLVAGVVTR